MLGRLIGLLALVLAIAPDAPSSSGAVAVALAAVALLVAAGSRAVVTHLVGAVGTLPGEVLAPLPVLSSRIADPVRQPVRPRAPGLV